MILGIDIGLANVGLAVYDKETRVVLLCETYETRNTGETVSKDCFLRAQLIGQKIISLLDKYPISEICAESLPIFHGKPTTSAQLGVCWGVIAQICLSRNISFSEITPRQLKIKAGAQGKDKKEIAKYVEGIFPNLKAQKIKGRDHAYDALALVL